MQFRDARNGDWYWVNNAVNSCPHITVYDKVAYAAICTLAGCKEIHPSYQEIARRSAISERQAKRSVASLIKNGYLSIREGGGRGRANVYFLLKVPKGCPLCTLSKRVSNSPETVPIMSEKGVQQTPQEYKEEYKEEDNHLPIQKSADQIPQVFKIFENLNPTIMGMIQNTTQRKAALFLVEKLGIEKLESAIQFLVVHNQDRFCPQIGTPRQMVDKLGNLIAYAKKVKNNDFVIHV
jgi:hypothetical protein